VRKKSLAEEIAAIDVMQFDCSPLPLKEGAAAEENFKFEGYDSLTLKKILEREYILPDPQTAQEIIGFYARLIAKEVKLPSQFAALAPKVREFFEYKAFGKTVNLEENAIVKAMNSNVAQFVCKEIFKKILLYQTITEQEPELRAPARWLSSTPPIPWSRQVYDARKCVFNLVPCGNAFEKTFAKFLDNSDDVRAFSKLPEAFGFAIEYTDSAMNLRNYYPDFIAVDNEGTNWLLETKGQQTEDVSHKDHAAEMWCQNATALTSKRWQYLKIMQKEFEGLRPDLLADLKVLS
jgi:type III restriction enzyme